jgi:hypothetical protein
MLYHFLSYLRFWFSATNQHGVHSPFVYNFVTKCLYKKYDIKGSKCDRAFLKSIAYFNAHNINIAPDLFKLRNRVKNSYPAIKFNQRPVDVIYMDSPDSGFFHRILREGLYHNDSIVFVRNIHHNNKSTKNWESFKENNKVTVSVDLFFCGALFFRKEQAKEHFKIRI